ncbi:MAG TPA: cation:proton antiporter [Candidatus Polarisedimenticolia bacterium]|nr:cation:proton antiporter [Candidatus Polarisedimenticolia bacterium]
MPDTALLLLQLVVVLATARLAGRAAAFLGQPRVIGEMVAGLALGPSLFGWLRPDWMHALFPADRMGSLSTLSNLGVILFMFVVGLHLDGALLGQRAKAAVAVSWASIVVPFALGAALAPWLHPGFAGTGVALLPFTLFLGAAMSVTAFPVLARILNERRLMNTPAGSIAIAAAAVDDVSAWCLLAVVVAVARGAAAGGRFLLLFLGSAAYVLFMLFVVRPALRRWQARRVRARAAVSAAGVSAAQEERAAAGAEAIGAAVLLALGSALVTEWLGVHALFGAFLAGAIVPREGGLARDLAGRLEGMVTTVLLPLFFAFTGLKTEIGLVNGALWGVAAVILLAAMAGKLGGAAGAARLAGMTWRDALAVGVLMNTRGLMELVILTIGLEIGVLSPTLFAMMVFMALVTTVMTAPLLGVILRRRAGAEATPAMAMRP